MRVDEALMLAIPVGLVTAAGLLVRVAIDTFGRKKMTPVEVAQQKIEQLKRGVQPSDMVVIDPETGCTLAEMEGPPPPSSPKLKPGVVSDPPWFVYALRDPRTHAIHYVGITMRIKQRYAAHLRPSGTTAKDKWIQELQAAGAFPQMELLEEGQGGDGGRAAEARWILKMRRAGAPLTNATNSIASAGVSPERLAECVAVQVRLHEEWKARHARRPIFNLEYWVSVIQQIWRGERIWSNSLDDELGRK